MYIISIKPTISLKGSFIPDRAIRELRDLTRYKTKLTNQVAAEKNRFLKVLEDANIKLGRRTEGEIKFGTGTVMARRMDIQLSNGDEGECESCAV